MAPTSILLQGGTILVHAKEEHVQAIKADLLIKGDIIKEIISPWFIDTHHHVWQTLLKRRHGNHTLLDYFAPGNFPFKDSCHTVSLTKSRKFHFLPSQS
jgi:cytosine/adenosine deaminase-related metal-dependent hydrolase